jgi:hypothetical protein
MNPLKPTDFSKGWRYPQNASENATRGTRAVLTLCQKNNLISLKKSYE